MKRWLIIIASSLFASALSYGAAQMRGREIMDENRARWHTALRHDVRALLAETQQLSSVGTQQALRALEAADLVLFGG